jgi:rsbT co-antagonist protein RsbR
MLTVVEASSGPAAADLEDVRMPDLPERMRFLEFGEDDIERLTAINDLARRYADSVIDDFYHHLLGFEDTAAFFEDPQILEHVKRQQKEYFLRLTQGNYDAAYSLNRTRIGAVHERIGLPVKSYLGMYNFYLRAVATRLGSAYPNDPQRVLATFLSLMKLTFLDIGLAIDTYIYSRERTILRQQTALQELPTPVLPLREGLLIVPVIGLIDSRRARRLTEQLLGAIRGERARVIVIDITGVQAVDSQVANHLVQTIEAARLMGARVILAGISPDIAQTMVRLGIDIARVVTVGDLQSAIEWADRLLDYKVTRNGAELAE